MNRVLLLISTIITLSYSAPLYGEDGGYKGYASYVPLHKQGQKALSRTGLHSDDTMDTSAGSPDIYRHEEDISDYSPRPLPKQYDVLEKYFPSQKHGYNGNGILESIPSTPYHHSTLYGQSDGGYKIADAYQNQNIDSYADDEHDYKDDYLSYPQPYEYGYALQDGRGNVQHKHETSDGHGNVKGTYGFTDEHGLYRSVHYVADKGGFRASIKTNEPGTDSKNPADIHIETVKGVSK